MPNLISKPPPKTELEALLRETTAGPLLPPHGADKWADVSSRAPVAKWVRQLRDAAANDRNSSFPELPDELYAEYAQTGYRLGFERVYFERRRRLARAAVDLLFSAQNDSRFSEVLADFLFKFESVFNEESWALPAHVKTSSGKDPWEIDLFAAETANLMAECVNVFGEHIPSALRTAIVSRLRIQVFDNYISRHKELRWTNKTNNWNAVCHQGIVGAALAVEEDPGRLGEILHIAGGLLQNFLNGFPADGGCSEGPSYWEYGFGWFAVLNEQLENRTHKRLSLFEGNNHIRKIATYGPQVLLSGDHLVNFADSRVSGGYRPQLLRYLGLRLDEPLLTQEAQRAYHELDASGLDLGANRCDLFYLLRLFLYCPDNLDELPAAKKPDVFFPDLQVLIARGHTRSGHLVEFAAKGGHNGEHHNHNDCGSFLLRLNGQSIVSEIGSPEYNRSFFGPDRYEALAARTLGHSLPMIDRYEQPPGKDHKARVLAADLSAKEVRFLVELTDCYPREAGCNLLLRLIILQKKTGILDVEDQFELERPVEVETALMTFADVKRDRNEAILAAENAIARLRPAKGTILSEVEEHFFSDHSGSPATIRRIVFTPETTQRKFSLRYQLLLDEPAKGS